MIDDTDTILDEMRDKVQRIDTARTINENRANALSETLINYEWLFKVIRSANSGKNIEWLETELEWLETDSLEGIPQHIVDHAIALAKQAIANQTPSLV